MLVERERSRQVVNCVFQDGHSNCSTCMELGIACTRIQPRKKRGPKNRYVQALRSQLDRSGDEVSLFATLGDDHNEPHTLERIATRPVLDQIIRDWFDWIHPLAPLLHPRQFMARMAQSYEKEQCESQLIILVASLCAATVASLRRRRRLYGEVTVERCLDLAEGLGLWGRATTIDLEWTTAMYNFSSATYTEQGMDSPLSLRLAAEALVGLRYQLYQRFDQLSFMDQQLLKRAYWLVFASQCTSDIHGWPMIHLHAPHEPIQSLFPLEISDDELLHGYPTSPGPHNPALVYSRSYVPGLNALSRLFLVWSSSQAVPHKTIAHLQEHIDRAEQVLGSLPPELTWKGFPTSPDCGSVESSADFGTDTQTVNLKVTELHIRSNLLEQMNTLARSESVLATPSVIIEERHKVADDLLDVLYNMPKEIFDANGYTIIPKIRDIGSALLDERQSGTAPAQIEGFRCESTLPNINE
ncbi:hypothetical protein K458DRAFT_396270 [Lentithecium fluviatile CBS 122367]|uniref:Transcription factor domain-containing protein n=1 Tax=Lentithecium fluviatile CBS 122367 TaxID=1168545 RepID=A0A6G1IH11_9PLEO|nr:hypothetical protein K458DRAFT_396270 [Lentithecium fluviatile CBS 122367]